MRKQIHSAGVPLLKILKLWVRFLTPKCSLQATEKSEFHTSQPAVRRPLELSHWPSGMLCCSSQCSVDPKHAAGSGKPSLPLIPKPHCPGAPAQLYPVPPSTGLAGSVSFYPSRSPGYTLEPPGNFKNHRPPPQHFLLQDESDRTSKFGPWHWHFLWFLGDMQPWLRNTTLDCEVLDHRCPWSPGTMPGLWQVCKMKESLPCIQKRKKLQLSLGICKGLASGPPQIPKSLDVQIPCIKWYRIYMLTWGHPPKFFQLLTPNTMQMLYK